jgi:hypothetical protein
MVSVLWFFIGPALYAFASYTTDRVWEALGITFVARPFRLDNFDATPPPPPSPPGEPPSVLAYTQHQIETFLCGSKV